ncbi:hypothetical protein LMG7974_01157 [Campylobacter majalis]|uniref:DUF19 domain-containing protein n=1 Tax=Campylobacter majalis TaxID=2790656 RepID=A0ABM8Q7L3_9BACT|nr:hypothetical protein [Campylobacter majalis]CAD7288796.1 hypothetical protein LMG7974_01157 [Campylobacter majalis]
MRTLYLICFCVFFDNLFAFAYDYSYTFKEPYKSFIIDFKKCSAKEHDYEKFCENMRFNIEILKAMCDGNDADACMELSEIFGSSMPKTQFSNTQDMAKYARLACEISPSVTRCRNGGLKVLFSIREQNNKQSMIKFKDLASWLLSRSCELGDFDSCEMLKLLPIILN